MKKTFTVNDMSCASCVFTISKVLDKHNIKSKINLVSKQVEIEYVNLNDKELKEILKKTGYTFLEKEEKKTKEYIKVLVSLFFALLIVILSMSGMVTNIFRYDIFVILQIILLIPNLVYNKDFLKKAIKSLNMYTLIQLGVISSIIYSFYLITNKSIHLYFETASVLIALQILGKYLEDKSKLQTMKGLNSLIENKPKQVVLVNDIVKNIEDVKVNDLYIVKSGDILPLDGVVYEGEYSSDESIITGESKLIEKNVGDNVLSGTTNVSGYAVIKVTKDEKNSNYSKLIDTIKEAMNKKPKLTRISDVLSKYFIITVLFITFLIGVYWYFKGSNLEQIFTYMLSTLVIACPCGLGLAIPTVVIRSVLEASKNNILLRNPVSLENLSNNSIFFFDKTGTLTEAKMTVKKFVLDRKYVDEVYSLEKKSEHVLSKPITEYILNTFSDVKIVDTNYSLDMGYGIKSDNLFIGSKKYILSKNIAIEDNILSEYEKYTNLGSTIVFISNSINVLGYIVLEDTIRKGSSYLIQELNKLEIKAILLTGDNEKTSEYIANQIGIQKVYANRTPDQKLEIVKKYQKDNKVVMVGDGINDTASLTTADVSISLFESTDVSVYSSDIVLMNNKIEDILKVIKLAKLTKSYIYQNLIWSSVYNVFGILLASGILNIHLTPIYAAMAMVLSSISVILNSFRMKLV